MPFESSARQYEMGTYPAAYLFSLNWSLEFLCGLGIRNIQKHNHELIDKLIEYLNDEPFYRITSSLDKKHRSSILSFTTSREDIKPVHRHLLKNNIVTALREGSIRVSVHLYNNDSDIKRLIAALHQAARKSE
jgi:selenocysteine lyase/cysteine desulfurase